MKTTLTVLSFIVTMTFASMAMALSWHASDYPCYDFSEHGSTPYTKTLTLGGFNGAVDTVQSATLELDFLQLIYGSTAKVTKVQFDSFIDTTSQSIKFIGKELNYVVPATFLNPDGQLNLLISGKDSTFFGFFDTSELILSAVELCATGTEATPIPEPGTIMLLGAGFVGLAVYCKRRRNA